MNHHHHHRRARSLTVLAVAAVLVPVVVSACRKKDLGGSVDQCNAILASVDSASEHGAQTMNESKRCYSNRDCVEVEGATCSQRMCRGFAVPSARKAEFSSIVQAINGKQCAQFRADNCEKVTPAPIASCFVFGPACMNGQCEMKRTLFESECEAIYTSVQNAEAAAMANADKKCATDKDCVLADHQPTCTYGCGGPAMAAPARSNYNAAIDAIAPKCSEWLGGNCGETTPKPMPSCAQPMAKCVGGMCALR